MRQPTKAALAAVTLLASACRPSTPPPSSEFLVAAGDSTYWVRTDTTGVRVRGSPILLARYGGSFYEVYVTEDDRSYPDATFVGQRIYRRDLVSGDSTLVFEDSTVSGMAGAYAADNPGARQLAPDEDPPDEPGSSTTAELTIIDVHGPYLSYDYHLDVEGRGPSWHATRRGVVDLRTGRPATVAGLFGGAAAINVTRQARRAFDAAIDSIVGSDAQGARMLASALRSYSFDASSFAITDIAGAAAVVFHVPGKGPGSAGGMTIPLPPIAVADAPWWRDDVRPGLPRVRADSLLEQWQRDKIELAARYDTAFGGAFADLTLRDSTARREWRIARVQTPIHHVHWLDRPALDSASRRSLTRAFNDAVFYDENVRTADGRTRKTENGQTAPRMHFVAARPRRATHGVPRAFVRIQHPVFGRRRAIRI